MEDLLNHLNVKLYNVSSVLHSVDAQVHQQTFLSAYQRYVHQMKQGQEPDLRAIRSAFSLALSSGPVFVQDLGQGRYLARPKEPVIQLQYHSFIIADQKCKSMVHGSDAISWGVQFAFPGLVMDENGQEQRPLRSTANGALFRSLQKWIRHHTTPTKLGELTFPIRLGKKCSNWIHRHPQI